MSMPFTSETIRFDFCIGMWQSMQLFMICEPNFLYIPHFSG